MVKISKLKQVQVRVNPVSKVRLVTLLEMKSVIQVRVIEYSKVRYSKLGLKKFQSEKISKS